MDFSGDLAKEFEEFLNQSLSSNDSSLDARIPNKEIEDMSLLLSDSLSGGDSLSSLVIPKQSRYLKTMKKEPLDIKNLKASNQDVGEIDVINGAILERNDKKEDVVCKDGKDTLEEKVDKERFFAALEEKHNSPLDYSLLDKNFNLDSDTLLGGLKPLNEADDINKESLEAQETNEDCFKGGGDSRSDQISEMKLRILEAINSMSSNSIASESLESTKDSKVSHPLLQEATGHEINGSIIPREKTENADLSYSKGDSHHDFSHADVLNKIELERELHRIEEDYFELKNADQNSLATVGSSGDGGKGIKANDRDTLQVKVLELQAQVQHQEHLLKGYQEENEKLYQQLKKNTNQKQEINSTNDRIAQENFKLKNELENLREELNKSNSRSRALGEQKPQNVREEAAVMKLNEELKAALILNAELTEEINDLKIELREKQKVSKAASLNNVNIEKVSRKKSLIPTLASREHNVSAPSSKKDSLVQYLEDRVVLLEGELKRKNDEEDKALRLLERNFIDVKTQYQEHLSYLEEQLKHKQVDETVDNGGFCPDPICRAKMRNYEMSITNLKKELQQLKESNKNNEKALKLELERFLQESESSKKLIRENFELKMQVSSMKNKYESELKAVRSIQSSTLAAQEARKRQLEEELRKSNSKLENLTLVTKHCSQLEMQVSKLKEDLKEAKACHSPKMKHMEEMNEKINNMKRQLDRRDQQLNDLVKTSPLKQGLDRSYDVSLREVEARHEEERNRWRMLVLEKVNEIQYFKQQLDIVLEFVKNLKQGGAVDSIEFMPPSFQKDHFLG